MSEVSELNDGIIRLAHTEYLRRGWYSTEGKLSYHICKG